MVEAWLHALLIQTLALTVAALVTRGLQAAVVRRLGAGSAYLCWLLVPVAMVAVGLPHPSTDVLAIRIDLGAMTAGWALPARPASVASASLPSTLALAVWAVGATLLAAVLTQRQRRFAALVDTPVEGGSPRLPAGAGPAVVGLWTRRIVLPRDFDSAFDDEERRLMLLHEGVHLRRGDNLWNLLATALLVLHWFNPIAWWAWRRMRADQETACDATVLRHESPAALATYAGALLKVQGVALTPPLATSWQSVHPLVERVRMLQLHRISTARHRAGLRIASLSIALAGVGGYAVQAGANAVPAVGVANDTSVMTAIEITQTSVHATASGVSSKTAISTQMRVLARTGEQALLRVGDGKLATAFEFGLTVSRLDGNRLQIDTRLSAGAPLVVLGSPRLILRDGERGSVSVDTGDAGGAFEISLTPKVLAGASVETPQRAL